MFFFTQQRTAMRDDGRQKRYPVESSYDATDMNFNTLEWDFPNSLEHEPFNTK